MTRTSTAGSWTWTSSTRGDERQAATTTPSLLREQGRHLAPSPEGGHRHFELVLASDYVQTNMDLACMEAANEAARTAVNGILDSSGSRAARCRIQPLHEPTALEPLRAIHKLKFRAGLPWGLPGPLGGARAPLPGAAAAGEYGAGVAEIRREERRHPPPAAAFMRWNQMFGFFVRGSAAAIQQNLVDPGAQRVQLGGPAFRALSNVVTVTFANTAKLASVPDQGLGVHARAVVRRLDSRRVDGGYPEVRPVLALHRGRITHGRWRRGARCRGAQDLRPDRDAGGRRRPEQPPEGNDHGAREVRSRRGDA